MGDVWGICACTTAASGLNDTSARRRLSVPPAIMPSMSDGVETLGTSYPRLGEVSKAALAVGEGAVQYSYPNNRARVEVMFIVDTEPMLLCILIINLDNPLLSVTLDRPVLMPGYRIRTRLDADYKRVLDALGVNKYVSGKTKFMPTDFFSDMVASAPVEFRAKNAVRPSDALRIRDKPVEEAEKIYYLHPLRHSIESGKHVSADNLNKTEAAFGKDVRDWCKLHNISTCWGPKPPADGERSITSSIQDIHSVVDTELIDP